MRLEMFTPDLTNRHEVAHAISVQLEERYNGVGKLSIVLPRSAYNASICVKNALLYAVERKLAFDIVEVVTNADGNEITIHGLSLNNRINRRGVERVRTIESVEKDVYGVVHENLRGLALNVSAIKNLTEMLDGVEVFGAEMLQAVIPVLESVGLGQRALFDCRQKTITWEIYKGTDLTTGNKRVAFSEEQNTAPGLVVDSDSSEYRNACFCKAKYKSGTEFTARVGGTDGAESRELWIDFSGDAQMDDESDAVFLTRVKKYAQSKLQEKRDRIGFTVDIKGAELGSAYEIGDLVCCASVRSKVLFHARITGATHTQDENGRQTKLTLGDPTLTILGG